MTDLDEISAECARMLAQLETRPNWDGINRIHHELAPVAGRLQAAVAATERERGATESVRRARAALDHLKSTQRQVGLDIRLGSPAALALGLQQAIQSALEVVEALHGDAASLQTQRSDPAGI